MGAVRIGTSGWVYPPWRGIFYPSGLRQRDELAYLSARLNSVELNASFYSLQRPTSYLSWSDQTPADFAFSVKGSRFITHMKRLRDSDAMTNFFASGILALGPKLGPILWQLPPTMAFDPVVITEFLQALPRDTAEAAKLAARHDERLDGRAWTTTDATRPLRHAIEVRHQSFVDSAFVPILREFGVAAVLADTAGKWPMINEISADFMYVRLHGDEELYTSGYTPKALRMWADRVNGWRAAGNDVYVYFDNDVKVRAPVDAIALTELCAFS